MSFAPVAPLSTPSLCNSGDAFKAHFSLLSEVKMPLSGVKRRMRGTSTSLEHPLMFECIASSSVNLCLTNKPQSQVWKCCLIIHITLVIWPVPCFSYSLKYHVMNIAVYKYHGIWKMPILWYMMNGWRLTARREKSTSACGKSDNNNTSLL